jgi:periplasmic divalent cation tolerance protein
MSNSNKEITPPSAYQIILCTCPDRQVAELLARQLLEAKLVACVNILPGITSMYHWEGQIELSAEYLLVIKAVAENYSQIEQGIVELHPYAIPEIIAIPITHGLPAYLAWLGSVQG